MKHFYISIFAALSIFILGSTARGQLPSNCRTVRGQIYCDGSPQIQNPNGCVSPKFDHLYPISPLQNMKKYEVVSETPHEKTYKMTDYYGGFTGDSSTPVEVFKASYTIKVLKAYEGMNTLVSKGHSLVYGFITLQDGYRYATYVPGPTRPVHKSEFDCISRLTADEAASVANALSAEMQSGALNDFVTDGPLFRRIR